MILENCVALIYAKLNTFNVSNCANVVLLNDAK